MNLASFKTVDQKAQLVRQQEHAFGRERKRCCACGELVACQRGAFHRCCTLVNQAQLPATEWLLAFLKLCYGTAVLLASQCFPALVLAVAAALLQELVSTTLTYLSHLFGTHQTSVLINARMLLVRKLHMHARLRR